MLLLVAAHTQEGAAQRDGPQMASSSNTAYGSLRDAGQDHDYNSGMKH